MQLDRPSPILERAGQQLPRRTKPCSRPSRRMSRIFACLCMSLHETPVATARPAAVLSVIRDRANVCGYRPEITNPCVGIRRYRGNGRERFLSESGPRCPGDVLSLHVHDWPAGRKRRNGSGRMPGRTCRQSVHFEEDTGGPAASFSDRSRVRYIVSFRVKPSPVSW